MLLTGATLCVGATSVLLGEFPRAREHLEQGITLYNPQQHYSYVSLFGEDIGISCRGWGSFALWCLGYPEQALMRSREALALAQKFAHPFSLGYALTDAAALHLFRREEPTTQVWAERLLDLAAEQGFAFRTALGSILLGWALAMQGQREEEIVQIR